MPARLRPADPADVAEALAADPRSDEQTRLLVKHFLAVLERPRAGTFGRGAGAAVRRGAGRPGGPAHPGHAARRRRDRRRDLAGAGDRRADLGRRRAGRAGCARAASGPT